MAETLSVLRTKTKRRLDRLANGAAVLIVAFSNLLPYRLCQSLRQSLLQLAGVKFGGRCIIRGPFYVQYPSRLTIGADCWINGHVHFENAAQIVLGKQCVIGPGAMFFTMNHRGPYPRTNEPSPVTLGERVLFGGAVRVIPGVCIGDDCVVGAGSVVTRDIADGVTVAGVPARPTAKSTAVL